MPSVAPSANDRARRAGQFSDVADELAQRVDPRSAQRVLPPDRRRQATARARRIRRHRRRYTGWNRASARGERHHRREAQQTGEQIEERVLATEDHGRLEDRPVEPGGRDRRLGLALAAQIPARARRIGVQARSCGQPAHAGGLARGDGVPRQARRALSANVCPPVSLRIPTRLTTAVTPCASRARHRRVADVGLDDIDRRQHVEVLRVVPAPRRNDDTPAVADEPARRRDDRRSRRRPRRGSSRRPLPEARRSLSCPSPRAAAAAPFPRGGTVPSRGSQGARTADRASARRPWRWRAPSSRSRASR